MEKNVESKSNKKVVDKSKGEVKKTPVKKKSGTTATKSAVEKKETAQSKNTTKKTTVGSKTSSKSKVSANKDEKKEVKKTEQKKVAVPKTSTEAKSSSKVKTNVAVKTAKKSTEKKPATTKKAVTSSEKTAKEGSRATESKKAGTNTKKGTSNKKTASNTSGKNTEEYEKKLNISFLDDELESKLDLDKLDKELKNRKKVSKKEGLSIIKNSFYNLIFAGVFILFLVFCNYGFYNIEKGTMIENINLFAFLFLGVSIMLIETAYKEDNVNKGINGIEALLMAIYTVILPYVLQKYTENFINVLCITGIVTSVYYIIKSIIVFFINKRDMIRNKDDVAKEKDENDLEDDYED